MSSINTRLAFVSLCGLTSYIWTSNTLTKYAALDDPQTTLAVSLLLASGVLRLISFNIGRFPGSGGQAHDPGSIRKIKVKLAKTDQPETPLLMGAPKRPSPYFQHVLVGCIVFRAITFHMINSKQQCSSPGIEPLFGLLVSLYDFIYKPTAPPPELDGPEDMWASVWDDFVFYLKTTPMAGLITMSVISLSTYITTSQTISSTYFCSSVTDGVSSTVSLQLFGLILDTTCAILMWRILWWAKTAKVRLRILSHALFVTALGCVIVMAPSKYSTGAAPYIVLPGTAIHDGLTLALWLISFCHILCEVSLITAPTLVVASVGISAGVVNISKLGSWMQISRFVSVCPLLFILVALIFQTATMEHNMLSFSSRFTIYLFLLTSISTCLVLSLFSTEPFSHHPLKRIIYERRVENDRWLIYARTSKFLRVAVSEYKHRYSRDPPRGFSDWFSWAMDHNAAVIDRYDQISSDLEPFWRIPAAELRARTEELGKDPGVVLVNIKGPHVTANLPSGVEIPELDELISIISEFAEHLPDLKFAVNLAGHPRVLPVGSERVYPTPLPPTISKRFGVMNDINGTEISKQKTYFHGPHEWAESEASYFRRMYAEACPMGSPVYRGINHMVSDHCTSCESAHSTDRTQFPDEWDQALKTCLQPDLMHLHSFFSHSPASHRVYSRLMPLFGKTKIGPFGDILMPFDKTPLANFDSERIFEHRQSWLFWRGYFTEVAALQSSHVSPLGSESFVREQAFHADLQHRAVYLVNNASSSQMTTLIVPKKQKKQRKSKRKSKEKSRPETQFIYKHMSTHTLNGALPFDIGFQDSSPICSESQPQTKGLADCTRAEAEFGTRSAAEALDNRYVFLPDNPLGPAPETLQTLHSGSVPFVSTVFRQWWTERVHPWVHFVPIDPRLQALHSTLAYFTGVTIPAKGHTYAPERSPKKDSDDINLQSQDQGHAEHHKRSNAHKIEPEGKGVAWGGLNLVTDPGAGTAAAPHDDADANEDADSQANADKYEVKMDAAEADAKWIALEGRSWAHKALRREDAGVYLYRLLLEWGRLVSDDRDEAVDIAEGS
ncbi:hypothetical protein BROUX41_000740 [Berkeleyomyces rouxiae]